MLPVDLQVLSPSVLFIPMSGFNRVSVPKCLMRALHNLILTDIGGLFPDVNKTQLWVLVNTQTQFPVEVALFNNTYITYALSDTCSVRDEDRGLISYENTRGWAFVEIQIRVAGETEMV
jgi:hypothetical protein